MSVGEEPNRREWRRGGTHLEMCLSLRGRASHTEPSKLSNVLILCLHVWALQQIKSLLTSTKSLRVHPAGGDFSMDVLTNAPKQIDGSKQHQVLFFAVSPVALNMLINVGHCAEASLHKICSLARIRTENIL